MSRETRAFGRQFKQTIVNAKSFDYSKLSVRELNALKRDNAHDRLLVDNVNRELIHRKGVK